MNLLVVMDTACSLHISKPEYEIYIGLKKRGVNVIVFGEENTLISKVLKENNIEVISGVLNKKIDFNSIKKLKEIILNKKIDIVYSTFSKGISNSIIASLGTKVKLVTYRGTTGGLYWWDISSWFNALNSRVDAVIGVSNAVTNKVKKSTWFRKDLIVKTIYKGHNKNWYKDIKPVEDILNLYNKEKFKVLYVGRKKKIKGYDVVKKIVKNLKNKSNIHFLIAGKDLKEINQSNVKYLGYRKDLLNIIKSVDLVLMTSRREGLPRIAIEALNLNVPIILTNFESAKEIVINNINGIITPIDDYKRISEKIIELSENKVFYNKIKNNIDEILEDKFTNKKTIEEYYSFFYELQKGIK